MCRRWLDALHHLAVKHLTGCIQNGQIEEQQLEKWNGSSDTAGDHDILSCSCIHLAYSTSSPPKKGRTRLKKSPVEHFETWETITSASVIADKVFFAGISQKVNVYHKVIDRLEPHSQSRCFCILELDPEAYVEIVETTACERLLSVLVGGGGEGTISLWNVQDETCLAVEEMEQSLFGMYRMKPVWRWRKWNNLSLECTG